MRCFSKLSPRSPSPGAPAFMTNSPVRDIGHNDALRRLSNRLVGVLHGCLRHHTTYDEATAWSTPGSRSQLNSPIRTQQGIRSGSHTSQHHAA